MDFALFAGHRLETSCARPDWCGDADLTSNGQVRVVDLRMFCKNWLRQNPWYGTVLGVICVAFAGWLTVHSVELAAKRLAYSA